MSKFKVTGFIVTMAAKTYLFGLAMLISNGAMIGIYGPKAFLFIGTGRFLGIPVPVYIMLVMTVLSHFLLKNTVFGRQVIAVGANDVTAKLSGVDPDRTRMIAYSISCLHGDAGRHRAGLPHAAGVCRGRAGLRVQRDHRAGGRRHEPDGRFRLGLRRPARRDPGRASSTTA